MFSIFRYQVVTDDSLYLSRTPWFVVKCLGPFKWRVDTISFSSVKHAERHKREIMSALAKAQPNKGE